MTMDPFPEQHDLIALFECEPTVTDEGVPWSYNHLTFVTKRKNDQVICTIEPGDHELKFDWRKDGLAVVSLELKDVAGLTTEFENGTEGFVVTFRNKTSCPLKIQLKPAVSVAWGTTTEPL